MNTTIVVSFFLVCLVFLSCFLSQGHASLIVRKQIDKLLKWKFNLDQDIPSDNDCSDDPSCESFDFPIPEPLFKLLTDVMECKKRTFESYEILQLMELTKNLSCTGDSMQKILKVVIEFASANQLEFLSSSTETTSKIKQFICNNNGFSVKLYENQLELDGSDINGQQIKENLIFMISLAKLWSGMRLSNLSLDKESSALVQKMLLPHLSHVSFVNCSFTFEPEAQVNANSFPLNFFALKNLTHLECINCFGYDLIDLLETLSSTNLTYLNISANVIMKSQQSRLESFLMKFSNLQTLIISNQSTIEFCGEEEFNNIQIPKITGEVLDLKLLTRLDLSGTVDVNSFLARLDENENEVFRLQEFNLSYNSAEKCLDMLHKHSSKFSQLKHLTITLGKIYPPSLSASLLSLSSLATISFVTPIKYSTLSSFFKHLQKSERSIKIVSRIEVDLELIDDVSQLANDSSYLSFGTDFSVEINDSFGDSLGIAKTKSQSTCPSIDIIVEAFKTNNNLNSLKLVLSSLENFEVLESFLSPKISEFSLLFCSSFKENVSLIERLKRYKFRKISLNWFDANDITLEYSFNSLINAKFWSETESFECINFPSSSLASLLKRVKMPQLKELKLHLHDNASNYFAGTPFTSVEKLSVFVNDKTSSVTTVIPGLSRLFPNVVYLDIETKMGRISSFNMTGFMPNLRQLKIICQELIDDKNFLTEVDKLSCLMHLSINQRNKKRKIINWNGQKCRKEVSFSGNSSSTKSSVKVSSESKIHSETNLDD